MMESERFPRETMRRRLRDLAARGARLGTSSWRYPGWIGSVYSRERYLVRGRFSKARFERECLREYAEVFPTVCLDGFYYRFPEPAAVRRLAEQTPEEFLFAAKATGEVTIKRFPKLARFGSKGGRENPAFLDATLFAETYLAAWEPFRKKLGVVIFEFSKFGPEDFRRGREFVEALERFLEQLPVGWPYAVEIRNRAFLHPEYFAALARRGVAHTLNNWTDMPPVSEQLALLGDRAGSDLVVARFLLKPGRAYEEAVRRFSPYREAKEPDPEGRAAGAALIRRALSAEGRKRLFLYVNNRFEGNAPETIAAMTDAA
ncbi:MAG: DUF72 domain-containing protein [Verrucomicrobia bacterium]|nr:DUF72 domain-containing protein [Verrucomicrobiota bacterium]